MVETAKSLGEVPLEGIADGEIMISSDWKHSDSNKLDNQQKEEAEGNQVGAFVPAALAGVAPLIAATTKDTVLAHDCKQSTQEDSHLFVSHAAGGDDKERIVVSPAEIEEKRKIVKSLLALSAEEESACLELINTVRLFPEIMVAVAANLDAESSSKLALICVQRLFNRWSCDYICFISLIEAAATALPGGSAQSPAVSRSTFIDLLLRAVCQSFDVVAFGRFIVQGACMHELEFLLNHPSNEINVQSVCRLAVEPMLLRMLDASKIDQHNGYGNPQSKVYESHTKGKKLAHGYMDTSHTPSSMYSSTPPLILRCALVGLIRSLGQTRALYEMSIPFSGMILKALVVAQQARHARVLNAASVSASGLIPGELCSHSMGDRPELGNQFQYFTIKVPLIIVGRLSAILLRRAFIDQS